MLSPETLLARIMADLRGDIEEGSFADEVLRREIRDRIAAFRKMITDEVRRRTAEMRGREQVARSAVPKQAEQVEFLSAHAEQLAQLRRTVQPARAPAGGPARRAPQAREARPAGHAPDICAARCPPAGCRCGPRTAPGGRGGPSW